MSIKDLSFNFFTIYKIPTYQGWEFDIKKDARASLCLDTTTLIESNFLLPKATRVQHRVSFALFQSS